MGFVLAKRNNDLLVTFADANPFATFLLAVEVTALVLILEDVMINTFMNDIRICIGPIGMPLEQNFDRRSVAEKSQRAGGKAVGSRLVDYYQVPRCGGWQMHFARQDIQGGAERPYHVDGFAGLLIHTVADGYRVVLADYLAKVAGGSQVLVQAAVGDQKHLAS